jgi:hypothetical protein
MFDYLIAVNDLLQAAFDHWLFGTVVWNVFLAVVLGYYVTNVYTFKGQLMAVLDEVRYLRRRIYCREDDPKWSPRTESGWWEVESRFDFEIIKIVEAMENHGFISAGAVIRQHCATIRWLITDAIRSPEATSVNLITEGPDRINQVTDDMVRQAMFAYWRRGHIDFVNALLNLKPTFLEMIGASTFAAWERRLRKRWKRAQKYLNGESTGL